MLGGLEGPGRGCSLHSESTFSGLQAESELAGVAQCGPHGASQSIISRESCASSS